MLVFLSSFAKLLRCKIRILTCQTTSFFMF
uniref:Uncharacterized protein n=1 Tax=Arundo donax TaxID=35708 RepID=A0A0A9C6J1_ARUDO